MRARIVGLGAILATSITGVTGAGVRAADRPLALHDVLARVGDYVTRYERDLSRIVAEEHYIQDGDPSDRPFLTHLEIKSDLWLVRAVGVEGYVQFRDVFEVDGQPVRDRSERLLKLFLDPSAATTRQAGQIMAESSRYNLGGRIRRNINVPFLALMFMHPSNRSRFKFAMSAGDRGVPNGMPQSGHFAVSIDVRVLSFRETGSPTLVHDPEHPRRDARSHGRVWVEPDTGRVLMTELVVQSAGVRSLTQVSYQSEPLVGFLVPVEMREEYELSKPSDYRIEGTATYSNFRQFTVKATEHIGSAKEAP